MDKEKSELTSVCFEAMETMALASEPYQSRLKTELKQIDDLDEYDYFLDLYRRKVRFPYNENNLLVAHLLGICQDFDINKEGVWLQGELPDIDVDYLPQVRDYLKTEWAAKEFGVDNVCAIGNYITFGIKSALIDMARVHGNDRTEIMAMTTKLGLKDEDGATLTFDKALETFPELAEYCKENPEVADSAKRLLNRNRQQGTHAGGLIIANQRIDNLVPLVKGKDNAHVSAFVEGLHGTDLGPLGLVKFDLLVVTNLLQIATACKLIKERHNISHISALPGMGDWSDTAYLNDPKSIKMANAGQLKGIFQFDSDGIRHMVREGTVTSFDDLVAYTALFRPGTLGMEMDKAFIRRKRGVEKYTIHPLMKPILGDTYGVMVYQEQVMRILNAVGGIPKSHCEKVRKAISKKKVKDFSKYKDMFMSNGQQRLGQTEEEVSSLWSQIESFAEYGFNKSHAVAYTYISSRLLYLKAHYPIEFFTAVLSCTSDVDKINNYRQECEKNGVKLNRININKSGWNFKIVDEEIYIGFSNIKGIGEDVSQRIVASQPYSSFEDFLQRFGTDAGVIKPLVGLCAFCSDKERSLYYEFYGHYKKESKKREDRAKRNSKSKELILEEMKLLIPDEMKPEDILDKIHNGVNEYVAGHNIPIEGFNPSKWKMLFLDVLKAKNIDIKLTNVDDILKVFRKYKKNIEGLASKIESDEDITFGKFVPKGDIEEGMAQLYDDIPQVAEALYYGFGWDHLLQYSKDYMGDRTFSQFDDETKFVCCTEVHIVKQPEKRTSKKGTEYYSIRMEDANWRQENVTVWGEDYGKFKEEFSFWEGSRKGHLLRVRLQRPGNGFTSYTFDSPPRHRKHEIPKEKEQDFRLEVLARPEIAVKPTATKPKDTNVIILD